MQEKTIGEELVEAQRLESLDDAKRFAAAWIDSAAMFARNADYWRARAGRSLLKRLLRR